MTPHTPIRRVRFRRCAANRESQSESVEERRSASGNLPGNLEPRAVEETESESPGMASAASSPGVGDDIWDSPLPPSHHLQRSPSDVASLPLTPLTPLTPPSDDRNVSHSTPATEAHGCISRQSAEEEVAKDVVATVPAECCTIADLLAHANPDEDCYFKPKKLVRNLTKVLQAITEANVVPGQSRYSLRPNYDFVAAAVSYTPARLPVSRSEAVKDEDVKCDTKVVHIAAVHNTRSVQKTRKSKTSLSAHLEHTIPIAIQARVVEQRGQCVASPVGKPHERCSRRIPEVRIDAVCRELSRCGVELDLSGFLGLVKQLIQAAMCRLHQKSALSKTRQKKLEELVAGVTSFSDVELAEFQAWVEAITSSTLLTTARSPKIQTFRENTQSAASKTPRTRDVLVASLAAKSTFNITPLVPLEKQTYLSGFKPYRPNCIQDLSVSDALRQQIMKPFEPSAQKDGFIYLFWEAPNFGAVKIGRTNNLAIRLEKWNSSCKRKHTYHPASQRGELPQIPHVVRIERLIHIELKDSRWQRWCDKCKQNHREWFDVGETMVTQIFRKWHDWIMQEPYALNPITNKWELRPEMIHTLDQVCEPVAGVEKQLQPRRARGATKGRGKAKRCTI